MQKSNETKPRHTLIVIEGTDGSGKKTQVEKLYEYLQTCGKENILRVSFPNYESPSSGPVKMYLGGEFGEKADCLDAYQASALYAVDQLCTMKKILNSLKKDTIIISDRYVQSNMIHQAGKIKNHAERSKFLEFINNFEFDVLKLPRADKVFFLDVPPAISCKITGMRSEQKSGCDVDIHERDEEHLRAAYNTAKSVAKKFGWHVIPCSEAGKFKSIEEIHELIIKQLHI